MHRSRPECRQADGHHKPKPLVLWGQQLSPSVFLFFPDAILPREFYHVPGSALALVRSSCLTQVSYWILLTFVRAMIPSRLVLARSTTVSGVSEWAASTWASLKPSQLHALQASSRLLSLGIKDHAKHREAPGKKLLSEKKLVSLSLGKTHLSSLSLCHVCVCMHAHTCAHIPVEVRVKGRIPWS